MDRLDFTRSISYDNFEKDVQNFFDQTMALYELIGVRGDIDICAESNKERSKITFILLMENKKEASKVFESIENHKIPIYGHTYIPELRKSDNSVQIALVEE